MSDTPPPADPFGRPPAPGAGGPTGPPVGYGVPVSRPPQAPGATALLVGGCICLALGAVAAAATYLTYDDLGPFSTSDSQFSAQVAVALQALGPWALAAAVFFVGGIVVRGRD